MNKNHKVVVTMTSWKKRIGNCAQVVRRILDNTFKPDIVFLNLSVAEFPKKEADLPRELVQLSKKDTTFRINWVPGPNTRTMKKVFPILPMLNDDDLIIYIDDDFILPRGFVQNRVHDFITHGCVHAISAWSCEFKSTMLTTLTGYPIHCSSQPSSLVTKRMLSGYEVFYNNLDVCYRSADDSLYTLLVTLNGYTYVPCQDYGLAMSGSCAHPINNNYRAVSPLKTMGVFKKNGYSAQNTYITNLLYLTIARYSKVPMWNRAIQKKLSHFRRLEKFEDTEFFSQVDDFTQVDIPLKENTLQYWYWNGKTNAGDYYNKYLLDKLYKCQLQMVEETGNQLDICLCGSILLNNHIGKCRRVVGCGIQTKNHPLNLPFNNAYIALRGKITHQFVKMHKMPKNPDILLCDPGLLLSKLYQPEEPIKKTHDVGIIVHYVDEPKVRKKYGDKYHIISMQTSDIEGLANDILSCKVILSSSLHGIIFAHSYGIPAYHVQFTDFFKNGNFKFEDYYTSFEGVQYQRFAFKNFNLDVQKVLDYHNANSRKSNPTMEQVKEKQRLFIQKLPYKQFLRNAFRPANIQDCLGDFKPESKPTETVDPKLWRYSQFMHG